MRPVYNLSHKCIQYVGTFVSVYMDICIREKEAYPGITTHLEIRPTSFLSNLSCTIPATDGTGDRNSLSERLAALANNLEHIPWFKVGMARSMPPPASSWTESQRSLLRNTEQSWADTLHDMTKQVNRALR